MSLANVLLVSADPKLRDELDECSASLGRRGPALHAVDEPHQGIEAARGREFNLALVELGADLSALELFVRELADVAPGTPVAAVFQPDLLPTDIAESQMLIAALRIGVRDFLRRPVAVGEYGAMLERAARPTVANAATPGTIVSFISNKGGVGKSTLALNTACGLARRAPGRTLLIDASLQLGVAAALLDLRPTTSLVDAARERRRLDETLVRELATPHESGLHLLAAPAGAVEAAEVDDETIARTLTYARRTYDYVIVDTFPLFDSVVMAILDLSDRAYVVLENVVPTLLGAIKLLELLDQLAFPREKLRVLLNRHASGAGSLPPSDVAARLGQPIDSVLPFDRRIVAAANSGRPYALQPSRWFGIGPALQRLTSDVEQLAAARRAAQGDAARPGGGPTP